MELDLGSVFSSQQVTQAGVLIFCDSNIQHNLGSFPSIGSERSTGFGISSEDLFLLQGPYCQIEGQVQNGRGGSTGAIYTYVHKAAQVTLLVFLLLSRF